MLIAGYPTQQEITSYIRYEKSFNVKPGDIVFIFRKAESFEGGWRYAWIDEMDFAIRKYGLVLRIDPDGHGILIEIGQDRFYCPYTCLRIIR